MRFLGACLVLAAFALPAAARAEDDDAALRATSYFSVCNEADFAEPQCLCFAKHLSHGGRHLKPELLTAMEQDFTLAGRSQISVPAVNAALSHHTPPLRASEADINAAIRVLAAATNSCSRAE
jgi:hypothetical protein